MYKYLFVAFVAALGYFMFFYDSYPSNFDFRENTFGVKEDQNNTLDKEFEIFSYKDKSNHHVLIFAIRNRSELTLDDLTKQYLGRFQYQGFKFKSDAARHVGVKGDEVIYMTILKNIEGVIIYIEKGGVSKPNNQSDVSVVFIDLENFTF